MRLFSKERDDETRRTMDALDHAVNPIMNPWRVGMHCAKCNVVMNWSPPGDTVMWFTCPTCHGRVRVEVEQWPT